MVRWPSGVTRIKRAGGRVAAGCGRGRGEGDAGGADVVREHRAELVLRDLADEAGLAAERGDAGHRVGHRSAGDLHGRPHGLIELGDRLGIDQLHGAFAAAVLRQERVVAAGDDIDDRIADADDVVMLHGWLPRPPWMGTPTWPSARRLVNLPTETDRADWPAGARRQRAQVQQQMLGQHAVEGGGQARALGGLGDRRQRRVELGQAPVAALPLEGVLLLEMRGRLQLAQGLIHGPARVQGAARAVQAQEVPLQGQDHRLRVLAAGDAAVAFADGCRRAARGSRHHDPVERQLGGVADGRLYVALLDAALAERIQGELLHLGARQAAVGAETGHQQRPRVRRDLQLGRRQHLADHAFQVARLVGKAGDGGRMRRLLEQGAQGIVGTQIAGLHDQEALQRRRSRPAVSASPP